VTGKKEGPLICAFFEKRKFITARRGANRPHGQKNTASISSAKRKKWVSAPATRGNRQVIPPISAGQAKKKEPV